MRQRTTDASYWPVRARAVHWSQLEHLRRLPRASEDAAHICDLEEELDGWVARWLATVQFDSDLNPLEGGTDLNLLPST